MFTLPGKLADHAGTDGWICIVLDWLLVCLSGWIMLLTLRKYPSLTLPELLEQLFGRWLGKLLMLLPIGYFMLIGWFNLATTSIYIKNWFLPKTPPCVILFLLAVPGYMIVRQGPSIHGRFCELVFYMSIFMILLPIMPLAQGHWLHLLPVVKEGWRPILDGAVHTLNAFAGIEIILLYYPSLQKKRYALHGLLAANTITLIIYLYVTIICFIYFSPDGIARLDQPLLILMKNVGFRFLERLDSLALAAYLLVIFTALAPAAYSATFTLSRLLGMPDHRRIAAWYFSAIVATGLIVQPTWKMSLWWEQRIVNAVLVLLPFVPIALYVYVWGMEQVRKRRPG
jgi:spore germination protein (amino acid permease)